jgi:hypothetical protein
MLVIDNIKNMQNAKQIFRFTVLYLFFFLHKTGLIFSVHTNRFPNLGVCFYIVILKLLPGELRCNMIILYTVYLLDFSPMWLVA